MKLPKTVKVGGHTYKILFPYEFKERVDLCGQVDHASKEVRISLVDGGGETRAWSGIIVSFIHELLHAIDDVSGHSIFPDNEPAIEGIAQGIYQVLVDNGWLPSERTSEEESVDENCPRCGGSVLFRHPTSAPDKFYCRNCDQIYDKVLESKKGEGGK